MREVRNCVPATDPATCAGTTTPDAATNLTTTFAYDEGGRIVAQAGPDPSAGASGTGFTTTRSAYDAQGRLCRVLEAATVDLATLADPCTTAVAGTATSDLSTRYTYDPTGNLVSMTDASGDTTTYAYDGTGRMTGRTDPLGAAISWRYDEAGNRTGQRNRTDPVPLWSVTWSYDAAGRMLTRTADGTTTSFSYDEAGNRLSASDATLAITATYDRLGRVLTVDDEDAGSTPDTTYAYSLTSPSWTDPTGTYAVTLDKFDRAVSLTDPVSAAPWSWTYRADGAVASSTGGNGNTTTQAFDAAGRLLAKTTK